MPTVSRQNEHELNYRRRMKEIHTLGILQSRMGEQPKSRSDAIRLFLAMYEHCPFPAWIKSADGVMLAKNPAYTEIFRKTDESYIGQMDRRVWARDEAENYGVTDTMALTEGYAVRHEPIHNQAYSRHEALDVVKWVWRLEGGERITVGMVTGYIPLPESARLHDG